MKLNTLTYDSRGQSEVVGTILMVAVAIVLGAIIGGYVFNIYQKETAVTPQVTFSYEYDDGADKLIITHESGDELDGNNVNFVCTSGGCGTLQPTDWSSDNKVTSGDSETLTNVGPDSTILIVWEQPIEDGKTAIIDEWEGPKA